MIVEVVADRHVDPRLAINHGRAIGRGLDNIELVLRSNAAAEENLGTSKCTGRQNHTASDAREIDNSLVAAATRSLDLDSSDMAALTDHALDRSVEPQLEVSTPLGAGEVGRQRAAALSVGVHVGGLRECAVLLVGHVIRRHFPPAIRPEAACEGVEAFLEIALAVLGWLICSGGTREHSAGRGQDIGRLPASREEVVPVKRVRLHVQELAGSCGDWGYEKWSGSYLPPETSINSSSAAEDAARHLLMV